MTVHNGQNGLITYSPAGNGNLDHMCLVSGIKWQVPSEMSREELHKEIEWLGNQIDLRMKAADPTMMITCPSSIMYTTECEAQRLHELKMALPMQGQLRHEARERIALRIAARKERKAAKLKERNTV